MFEKSLKIMRLITQESIDQRIMEVKGFRAKRILRQRDKIMLASEQSSVNLVSLTFSWKPEYVQIYISSMSNPFSISICTECMDVFAWVACQGTSVSVGRKRAENASGDDIADHEMLLFGLKRIHNSKNLRGKRATCSLTKKRFVR